MKLQFRYRFLALPATLCWSLTATAQFTPGNLVVLRAGTGVAQLNNAATPTFLDEYTPAGTLVQSVPMPTIASGSDRACTVSGSATSEGLLSQSVDGRYLIAVGYDAIPGTASIAASTSATVNRVIARIALDGTIDTSTALTDVFSGNNIRGAASEDGSQFWATGATNGVVLAPLGATSGTSLHSALPVNLRSIGIHGDQLYVTSASGATRGIITIGSGVPTTNGQVPALLNGFPTATASPYDFFFANDSTAYVADDRTSGGAGGIQKWTETGGLWSFQYTFSLSATVGARGLTGVVENGIATLFATTTNNQLITVTDTGPSAAVTSLATAATNTAMRGLRYVRRPWSFGGHGTASPTTLGDPTLTTAGGRPVVGNTGFQFVAGNLVPAGFGFLLLGIGGFAAPTTIPGAPGTAEIYVSPLASILLLADPLGAADYSLPLPQSNSLAGLPLPSQLIAFDPAMAFPIPLGTSAGLQVTIGQAGM